MIYDNFKSNAPVEIFQRKWEVCREERNITKETNILQRNGELREEQRYCLLVVTFVINIPLDDSKKKYHQGDKHLAI